MKKRFYKGSAAIAGVLASTLVLHAQTAGVGSAGAGAAGAAGTGVGGATSAGVAGGAPGAGIAGGQAGAGVAGAGASPTANAAGNLNTIGAAGINQPGGTLIGGGNIAGATPNTVGAATVTTASPGGSPVPGAAGQPQTGGITAAQAGIPLTSLPSTLQQSIQSQLGSSTVQTISRDDLANGSVYRITALQNGVPTEMRFGANGAFLGSAVLPGTATSVFTPGAVVLDTLPAAVQNTVRSQAGNGRVSSIVPQGQGWVVTYDINGQPTTLLVAADGRILRAGTTATGIGSAPAGTAGSGGTARAVTNNTRTSSVKLEELPQEVRRSLEQELGAAEIQFINREQRATGEVYLVGARKDGGDYLQVTLDSDGRVVRDTRETKVIAVGAVPRDPELDSGIPFSRVPLAVQNAVKAYAAASDVRAVNLGTDQGRTVYDVVFMQSGRRDRLIVAKDGTLIRREQDVSAALDNGKKEPRLAIGDLPPEVRETIRRQTDNVLVKDVLTKRVGDEVVYAVRYETNGAPVELMVDSRGAVVVPETSPNAQAANAPQPAPVRAEKEEVVKTVPASKTEAAGGPATTEIRVNDSANNNLEAAPVQKVTLGDVPPAVQASAKKFAGTGVIESINPKLGDSGVVYEVTISNGTERNVVPLNKDGIVQQNAVKPNRP